MFIKKLFFIFLIALSLNLTAQNKPFQFGFKAGPNIGWYSSNANNYDNHGVDFGGSWGFTADIFLMDNYSFTTGFDMLYLNGTMSYPDTSSSGMQGTLKRSYRTKYIRLPIIFTMKTNEINKLKYFGQIGFGLSILLTAKANDEFTSDIGGDVSTNESNIYDEMRFTRESLILGGGVEIPLQGSTHLRIGLIYDSSLVDILKGYNAVDSSVKNNGNNSFISLDVSFFF